MIARVAALYRYPVKGLSPERLGRTTLSVGQTVPCDRLYAVENGPSGFDPANRLVLTRGGDTTGVRAGQADTDADGRASLTREDGIYGPALPNETVHGYKAKFSVLGTVDGKTHCPTEVEAPITCRAGDSEGTCEPKPLPG